MTGIKKQTKNKQTNKQKTARKETKETTALPKNKYPFEAAIKILREISGYTVPMKQEQNITRKEPKKKVKASIRENKNAARWGVRAQRQIENVREKHKEIRKVIKNSN